MRANAPFKFLNWVRLSQNMHTPKHGGPEDEGLFESFHILPASMLPVTICLRQGRNLGVVRGTDCLGAVERLRRRTFVLSVSPGVWRIHHCLPRSICEVRTVVWIGVEAARQVPGVGAAFIRVVTGLLCGFPGLT